MSDTDAVSSGRTCCENQLPLNWLSHGWYRVHFHPQQVLNLQWLRAVKFTSSAAGLQLKVGKFSGSLRTGSCLFQFLLSGAAKSQLVTKQTWTPFHCLLCHSFQRAHINFMVGSIQPARHLKAEQTPPWPFWVVCRSVVTPCGVCVSTEKQLWLVRIPLALLCTLATSHPYHPPSEKGGCFLYEIIYAESVHPTNIYWVLLISWTLSQEQTNVH